MVDRCSSFLPLFLVFFLFFDVLLAARNLSVTVSLEISYELEGSVYLQLRCQPTPGEKKFLFSPLLREIHVQLSI